MRWEEQGNRKKSTSATALQNFFPLLPPFLSTTSDEESGNLVWGVGRRHQFGEVRGSGKGRSLEVGLANQRLGETSSVWKNRVQS